MDHRIQRATADDLTALKFLQHLAQKNKHALGFLPWAAYAKAIQLERVLLLFENDEPAGYMIHGPPLPTSKIYHVCIAEDCRRIEHGTALVDALKRWLAPQRVNELSLHCAEDLEANRFWTEIGFQPAGRRRKRKDKNRWQNRYQWTTARGQILQLKRKTALTGEQSTALERILMKGRVNLAEIKQRGLTRRHNNAS